MISKTAETKDLQNVMEKLIFVVRESTLGVDRKYASDMWQKDMDTVMLQ